MYKYDTPYTIRSYIKLYTYKVKNYSEISRWNTGSYIYIVFAFHTEFSQLR